MAYYSCTTIGCYTSTTVTTYTSIAQCQAACIGWGCGPSPELAPDADILFVFDASGSFPTVTIEEYFKATTAWTQTLTQNGWVGDANWVSSQDLGGTIEFTKEGGTNESTTFGFEHWLSWGSIPYTATNLKPDGTKDLQLPTVPIQSCPGLIYCSNPGYPGNVAWNIPGADQYFSKYTVRPDMQLTGLTYPTNDQLVITISEANQGYDTLNGIHNGVPSDLYIEHYELWKVVQGVNKPADRNYKAWAIPATFHEPWYPLNQGFTGGNLQKTHNHQMRFMLNVIDDGNQDDMTIVDSTTGLPLGTGTLDGTWITIPNGSLTLDGTTTCNEVDNNGNPVGCSTMPVGPGSANPCSYNGHYGSPGNPGPGGTYDVTSSFNPCYTHDPFTGVLDISNGPYGTFAGGYADGSINQLWANHGKLGQMGWSHRAYDNTLNNPQTDLINLLNNEIIPNGTVNWVPVGCFSAETNYSLSTTHPYSSYASCLPCVPQWHCDGLGTPCYSAYTSGGPNWYADEVTCQSSCNTTPIWSCATEGCVSGYTFNGTTYATSALCASDCVGWGCETIVTDLDADVYVFYDNSSMGTQNINDAYYGVEAYLDSLGHVRDRHHVINSGERWLMFGHYVFIGSSNYNVHPGVDVNGVSIFTGNNTQSHVLPVRDYDDNTLIILFIDESHSDYHEKTGDLINTSAPTSNWKTDYNWWTTKWNNVLAHTGNTQVFMYPTTNACGIGLCKEPIATSNNPTGGCDLGVYGGWATAYENVTWSWAAGTGNDPLCVCSTARVFAEHTTAAIHSGNNLPLDGKWKPGTAPVPFGTFTTPNGTITYDGIEGSTVNNVTDGNNELCNCFDLQSLETFNPYWDSRTSCEYVASHNVSAGQTKAIVVSGDGTTTHVYVATGTVGLTILDVSNPTSTLTLGSLNTNGTASGVTTYGNYAYIADGISGLTIADVSDASNPTLAGTWTSPLTPALVPSSLDVAVSGNSVTTYAYIVEGISGLTVIDVSTPSAPTLVGYTPIPGISQAISVSGNHAYIACGVAGLTCVDISNPLNPTITQTQNTVGEAVDVAIQGNYAYVASDMLRIYDITSPTNLNNVSNYAPTYTTSLNQVKGVSVEDWRCVITVPDGHVVTVDVSNPLTPIQHCGIGNAGHDWESVAQSGEITYIVVDSHKVRMHNIRNKNYGNWGALDQKGFKINTSYPTLNSTTLEQDLNTYITENTSTATVVASICSSAETNYLTHATYTSATESQCWVDCDIQGWTCGDYGCTHGLGPSAGVFLTIEDCLSGVTGIGEACTSYNCSTSGCTLYNLPGDSNYTGSGNLGTGGTHTTLNGCLLTECSSWDCTSSGCTQYNISTGTTSYNLFDGSPYQGSGGTGGTYSTSNCDDLCSSFDCTTTGCCDYNISAGTTSYNLFAGSPYQGEGGTGGTYASTVVCSAVCISYECSDYGCVLHNDPDHPTAPNYTNGTFGSGGTYSSLNSCTAACQSFGCELTGCEAWNSPSNTNSMSYIDGDVLHDLGGNYGTGGTTLAACTATCFTWGCSDTGCTSTAGYDPLNPWQWNDEIPCNQNCTSHNCTDTGCVVQAGSGGTFTGNNSLTDCNVGCTSWECNALTGVNGGITLSNTSFNNWNQDSCTEHSGTGGTFNSLNDCHTGTTAVSACTSWSCQYPGNYYEYPNGTVTNYAPNGCLQFANTGNTYSQLTYEACTAQTVCDRYDCTPDGCVIGDQVTGTYDSFSGCTGGTPTLPACQSWNCAADGCESHNPNGTYGTGGTNTISLANCNSYCVSYSCTTTGCSEQAGYSGTYYDQYSPSNALAMCQSDCYSFNCIDDGCEVYNSPGSDSEINGLSGSGGTYLQQGLCDTNCISWNCGIDGCESQIGTGGTYTTKALCTGSCQSWACATTGCTGYNDPLYPNSPGYSDGEYGTGGTIDYTSCTATCVSWNCTNTGCVVTGGTQGMYSDLPTCNTACSSWDCISSGCTEYNISAGTASYSSGSGGTGGTYFNSSCDNECSSWDCTSSGCTEYNVSAYTASYNLFAGTPYQGHGGSGGTYTSDTCNNICHSYDCLEVEINAGWTWQDNGCIIQSGTGSTFYSGIVSLAGVVSSYTACTGECRSWSCENPGAASVGCLEYPNTGTTNTYDSLLACSANTSCVRYDCTDYGCVVGDHITGDYSDYGDCVLACTSWACEHDGCEIYNDTATGTFFQLPGGGTGGTFTTNNCDDICQSYNCNSVLSWDDQGCQPQAGSGGTYFNIAGYPTNFIDCQTGTTTISACTSWSCENPSWPTNGCINYPNTGSTAQQIMFDSYSACTAQTICDRYDCTPNGCVIGSQVTGDFDTFNECTGGTVANNHTDACQSWNCTASGTTSGVPCEVFNGPNSVGITSTGVNNFVTGTNYGKYGTAGASNNLANCNTTCKSYNCTDIGCESQIGYDGGYDDDTCSVTGGIYNVCYSYDCQPFNGTWEYDHCIQWPGSGQTFFNPSGIAFSLEDCQTGCTSWSCQNPGPVSSLGCLEYPNTGNTLSQPTYNTCTAETVCWRYDCTAAGCVVGSQTGGTYDSLDDCLTGVTNHPACESWQCTNTGCEEFNSLSYAASPHFTDGTRGTGGTNTISMVDCNQNCRSYSCEDYGCEQHGGTGHTYLSTVYSNEQSVWSLCTDNCKSWDCIDVGTNIYAIGCQVYNQLVPPNAWTEGGLNGFGTGGTYTGATCDSGCTSWRCEGMGTFGCTQLPNTASTYSSYTSCTANTECKSYDCTVSGCLEMNYEFTGGIDSYSAMSSCTEACVGWACIRDVISTGTSIYAYYDISNLSFGNILNTRIKLQNYVNSNFPTFDGQIYHTLVSDGRWLDWANSIYSGEFSVSPGASTVTYPSEWEPTPFHDERALLGIRETNLLTSGWLSDNWHDQYSAGTYTNIGIASVPLTGGNIASLTTHGIAPTANTSNNVIVISFITEADGIDDNSTLGIVSTIHGYHDSTYVGAPTGNPIMLNQPMIEWKEDYTAYTQNYNTVSGDSGTIRALLYPVRVAGSATVFNPQSSKMGLLQSYAAIASGDQTVPNGTWLPGNAPRPAGQGGVIGTAPELCWQNLDQLESSNPYWTTTTPTYGGLDMSGWTVNIQGSYLGSTNFTGFLDDYLVLTTSGLTAGTCTSAETLYTASVAYSLSSETECDVACVPTMYVCTTTGCTLDWSGYLTLAQCSNRCKSVKCTGDPLIGCEWYNSPTSSPANYIDGNYGSGGTWTGNMGSGMMADCHEVCISTNCNGYPSNLAQQGCIQQQGTGGTWTGITSFTACTGSCMSWTCDDPCQYETSLYTLSSGGVGCVEWPNTGATYSALTACTATCQENYYCTTGLTADTCNNMANTAIISSDIIDHIDAISASIAPNWTNTRFDELKFILTNVITAPTNACYDNINNGYWVYITDIRVDIQVGTAIPQSFTFLDWDDLLGVMNGTPGNAAILVTPMTEISDILNVPGITVTVNQEFCLCTTVGCTVGCTNTSSLPSNSSGFYPTYLSAQTTCCPLTTWSCVTNTTIDNCDGLTTLDGIFLDVEACYNYMHVTPGWDGFNFTNVKCEITPTGMLNDCEIGPHNGELVKLTGITTTIPAISSTVHTSWTGLTATFAALSIPVTIPPLCNTLVVRLITNLSYPGVAFMYGWLDCECDNPYTCECVEIAGSGGTYTSQTLCEEACCSATTWNCVQDQPYLPICQDKQFLGASVGSLTGSDLNWHSVNAPSQLFGLSKWVINGPTSPLLSSSTLSQVNSTMAGSGNGDYCFRNIGSPVGLPNIYLAYWYIYSVSHQLINSGTEYQTWNDFYNATDLIVTACTQTDTPTIIEGRINTHFGISAYTMDVHWKSCCSPSPCYCYDTLTTVGEYNSEVVCDAACCPPEDELSWICTATTYSDDPSTVGGNSCQFGYYGAPSLNSINNTPGYGPWSSYTQCTELSYICAKSWRCSVLTPPPLPCFGQPCLEQGGHYSLLPDLYPTEYSCNTNTDLDCCGPEALYICMSSETTTTMSGLTRVPDNSGTLGYHSSDEVLSYLADPTASPTRQYSGITAFTFCKFETDATVLNAAEESCKCGDGCDGIFNSSDYIVYNNLLTSSGSNGLPYHPATNPEGYCTNWADMIAQLNTVWDTTGTLGVTLNDTFNDVVTATTNVIGNIITISISGLESCVDITGPCFCDPCFTPNCGMHKSDCEAVCCVPTPTTWTCTPNGCLDVCNGEGEFATVVECRAVCYEWGCMDDVWGCTDTGATNYNTLATIDDGGCEYPTDRWSCQNIALIDGCASRTHVSGGLSFTAAIYGIANLTNQWYDVEFSTLKFDLGGGNNHMQSPDDVRHQLPYGSGGEPCEVPCSPPNNIDCINGISSWGQPGPYMAYIKYLMYSGLPGIQYTTWKSFIDAINTLGYTFTTYFTPGTPGNNGGTSGWQDLEAVLGASQLHCEWTWCKCGTGCNCVPDVNGPYTNELQCDSDTNNCCESWDCVTTYATNTCSNRTDIGFNTSVLWPFQPLEFMVNNGYQYTDVSTLKFIFNNPVHLGFCPINNNTQHWASYVDISVGNGTLFTQVQTWDDAITWVNTNTGLSLLSTTPYSIVMTIINASSVYIKPNLYICECTGVECGCVELFDGSGLYNTSGDCGNSPSSCCYVPPVSYDCDCVTTPGTPSTGVFYKAIIPGTAPTTTNSANLNTSGAITIWQHSAANAGQMNLASNGVHQIGLSSDAYSTSTGGNLITNVMNQVFDGISTSFTTYVADDIVAQFNFQNITQSSNFSIVIKKGITATPFAGGLHNDFISTIGIITHFNGVFGPPGYSNLSYTINNVNGDISDNDILELVSYSTPGNTISPIMSVTLSNSNIIPSVGTCTGKTLVPGGSMGQVAAVEWICDPINSVPPTTLYSDFYHEEGLPGSGTPPSCCTASTGNQLLIPMGFNFHTCNNDPVFGATYMPFNTFSKQEFVDQLVTAGLAATNSMTLTQLKGLLISICGGGGHTYHGQYCICANNPTTSCSCIDPLDGSGMYSSIDSCKSSPSTDCYTGTTGGPCISSNCVGSVSIPDSNFENFLETHSGTTNGGGYGSVAIPATWPNTMGNGTIGDNSVLYSNICCVVHLDINNLNISDLTGIENFGELVWLHCGSNQLTTIDVSNNTNLLTLWTESNQLTVLDISDNVNLGWVSCQNNQLTSLDTSGNPVIYQVLCYGNTITSLDFSQNPLMKYIWCWQNLLTSIDVSMLTDLRDLRCGHQPIGTIDVTNNLLLERLYCESNTLTTLDVSNNVNLEDINFGGNPLITTIDVSMLSLLERLVATHNQLTTLDVTNNTALTRLYCGHNQITVLDLTQNTNLNYVICNGNNMTHLYLGSVLDLNNITTFTAMGNPSLTIHVGTTQRITDFQNIFIGGTNYDFGINITI